jgi:hypothetical protein
MEGSFPGFDYMAAFQIGSGMSIRHKDGSYLVTSRVGSVPKDGFQYGLSFLIGDVLRSRGMSTFPKNDLTSPHAQPKMEGSFDCRYDWREFDLSAEFVYGSDRDNMDSLGYLAQVGYKPARLQNLHAELQFKSWINDLGDEDSDDAILSACLSYKLTNDITLRAAYILDIDLAQGEEDNRFVAQFYYYGL